MNAEDYDRLFDEVRAALMTDIEYAVALARAAQNLRARRAGAEARRAAKAESNTANVSPLDADDV